MVANLLKHLGSRRGIKTLDEGATVISYCDAIVYTVAAYISTLFLLGFGAHNFVEHADIVARRSGIPETIIAPLTAGAEWEEEL
ncbi:Fc.00g031770.m01.CDS01 [Cosmosporella sp. VM-42]